MPNVFVPSSLALKVLQHSLFVANRDGIPGLDMDGKDRSSETFIQERKGKYTFTKKIDRSFAAAWEGRAQPPPRMGGPPQNQQHQNHMQRDQRNQGGFRLEDSSLVPGSVWRLPLRLSVSFSHRRVTYRSAREPTDATSLQQ